MKNNSILSIREALSLLASGEIVAIPTETVYGLAADASNIDAIAKIFIKKGRPSDHPLIVHISNIEYLKLWVIDIPPMAYKLAEYFWPGPLTLVLNKSSTVSKLLTGGQETIALRVPKHPLAQELLCEFSKINKFGGLAAPSANRFGHISPTCVQHVFNSLGNNTPILDGGNCTIGIESTIVDLTSEKVRVLRPGQISIEKLDKVLGYKPEFINQYASKFNEIQANILAKSKNNTNNEKIDVNSSNLIPKVSGSLLQHYSPLTPCYSLDKTKIETYIANLINKNIKFVFLGLSDCAISESICKNAIYARILPNQVDIYANQLYSALYDLDQQQLEKIIILLPPNTSEWLAVHDRIFRASKHE